MRKLTKKGRLLFLFATMGCLSLFAFNALALQTTWPTSPAGTSLDDSSTFPVLIQYFYEWGIALGGLAVFISLIIAGIQYLTSFGDPASMKEAMSRIKSAFGGIVLLLASWLILNTINPNLTSFELSFTGVVPDTVDLDDNGDIKFDPKPCDKVLLTHGNNFENPAVLEKNVCYEKLFVKGSIEKSVGVVGTEEDKSCSGYLILYADEGCANQITSLPVRNTNVTVDNDKNVRSIMYSASN